MIKTPCDDCPFRIEGGIRLEPERAREIAKNAADWNGGSFDCHKTTGGGETTDDGEPIRTGHEDQCAGAVAFALRVGQPNQFMRIGMRVGFICGDFPDAVLRSVFPSVAAMVRANPGWRAKRRSRSGGRRS